MVFTSIKTTSGIVLPLPAKDLSKGEIVTKSRRSPIRRLVQRTTISFRLICQESDRFPIQPLLSCEFLETMDLIL